jgi:hypothetical protein
VVVAAEPMSSPKLFNVPWLFPAVQHAQGRQQRLVIDDLHFLRSAALSPGEQFDHQAPGVLRFTRRSLG